VGAGVGSLPVMGVEEVAVECAANLGRKCGRAAACIVTPVLGGLVDGFVGQGQQQLHKQEQGYEGVGCTGVAHNCACP